MHEELDKALRDPKLRESLLRRVQYLISTAAITVSSSAAAQNAWLRWLVHRSDLVRNAWRRLTRHLKPPYVCTAADLEEAAIEHLFDVQLLRQVNDPSGSDERLAATRPNAGERETLPEEVEWLLNAMFVGGWPVQVESALRELHEASKRDPGGESDQRARQHFEAAIVSAYEGSSTEEREQRALGEAYDRFVSRVVAKCVLPRSSRAFGVAEGVGVEPELLPWTVFNVEYVRLQLVAVSYKAYEPEGSDFLVGVTDTIRHPLTQEELPLEPVDPAHPETAVPLVCAQVGGIVSSRALEELQIDCERALRSFFSSLTVMSQEQPVRRAVGRQSCFERLYEKVLWGHSHRVNLLARLTGFDRVESKPLLSFAATDLHFVNRCTELYFSGPAKRSLAARLRNAARVLVQADQQEQASVALALCFAAIEAMLCRKTIGIVDELARNAATLLEHEPLNRQRAMKAVKKLYDARSKLLHGENIDVTPEMRVHVRRLAAGCLKAILEWEDYVRRLGEQTTSDQFFLDELEASQVSGKRMVGVPDVAATWLPVDSGDT